MKNLNLWLCALCIFFYSCTERNTNIECAPISVSEINNSLLEQIDFYWSKHQEFKSLLILSDIDQNWYNNRKIHNYWIIGPAYKNLDGLTEEVSLFFKYKNSIIFVQSSLNGLIDSSYAKKVYRQNGIEIQTNNVEVEQLFYDNAIICEQKSDGNFDFVSDEVKRRIDFTVPPIQE